jgi:hypothetical protein
MAAGRVTPRCKLRRFSWGPPEVGKDLANGFCCGGTLGSLVRISGTQYILSNYHVFESDIVSGGNNTVATTGDPIIQPGQIDVNCNVNGAQTVATLVKKSSLPNNNVDCSVGKAVAGQAPATAQSWRLARFRR